MVTEQQQENIVLERRREALRHLVALLGGPTALARRLGYESASFISQMAGPKPTRNVSEEMARKIEATFQLPFEWLDNYPEMSDLVNQNMLLKEGRKYADSAYIAEKLEVREPRRPFHNEAWHQTLPAHITSVMAEYLARNRLVIGQSNMLKIMELAYKNAVEKQQIDEEFIKTLIDIAAESKPPDDGAREAG